MNKTTGFSHTDAFAPHARHRVWFIEPKGKDISFDRWRFELYYEPHKAMTHFEPTQAAADKFMAEHAPSCFDYYTDFRSFFDKAKS